MNKDGIARAFMEESADRAENARNRINHCLDQLTDEDMWWTPSENANSIGIIIQHLCGNLGQWAVSGVGGKKDTRERPKEFIVENKTPKKELQAKITARLDQVIDIYRESDPGRLLEMTKIQGMEVNLLYAVYSTMTHLALHAGQIMYIAKIRAGTDYEPFWVPANKEQGA
jgi:hypothetical protein